MTIVAVAYHSAALTNLDHPVTKPERLMAMLTHRDTVPPACRVTLDKASCRVASLVGEFVGRQKRVLTEQLQGRSKRSDFRRCCYHGKDCNQDCVDVFLVSLSRNLLRFIDSHVICGLEIFYANYEPCLSCNIRHCNILSLSGRCLVIVMAVVPLLSRCLTTSPVSMSLIISALLIDADLLELLVVLSKFE